VFDHLLDETSYLKFIQSFASQGASDLKTLRDNGGGDQLVRRNFLVQFVVSGLIEQNQVVQLVTDLSFRPLLLLGLATSSLLLFGRSL